MPNIASPATDPSTRSALIGTGGRVELNIFCMLPTMLSKFDGYNHDILSGANKASAQPMFACGPLKDRRKGASTPDATLKQNVRQAWHDIMKTTAQHFAKHGDKIAYLVGNEPESYFAGDELEFFELFEVTVRGLRAGYPKARVGGITTAFEMVKLLHTNPTYDTQSDTFGCKLLEQMRETHGLASTVMYERPYEHASGTTLDLEPNSVHLLVFTAK